MFFNHLLYYMNIEIACRCWCITWNVIVLRNKIWLIVSVYCVSATPSRMFWEIVIVPVFFSSRKIDKILVNSLFEYFNIQLNWFSSWKIWKLTKILSQWWDLTDFVFGIICKARKWMHPHNQRPDWVWKNKSIWWNWPFLP